MSPTVAIGSLQEARVEVISGASEIARFVPRLLAAAEAWGQRCEVLDLEYFASRPGRLARTPLLITFIAQGEPRVLGAVLMFAYGGVLKPFGMVSSGNRTGRRTVFAPAEKRTEAAALAARALVERGARYVNLDFESGSSDARPEGAEAVRFVSKADIGRLLKSVEAEWALQVKRRHFDMVLGPTYEATRDRLGKESRRNAIRYRRRCEEECGSGYVPYVEMERDEFLRVNARAKHGVSGRLAEWRWESLTKFANVFLAGVRSRDGEWLSLIGARRNDGEVEIDWMIHAAGHERLPLALIAAAYLMEDEVARGSTSLVIEPSHAFSRAFEERLVVNLAVRKRSVALLMLERFLWWKSAKHARLLFRTQRAWEPCG